MKNIEKPVRKVFTMESYMKNLRDNDIRSDQEVQRAAGQYSKNMNNELIFTILSDDYVPPIIIGEDLDFQKWIIDGLQRSACYKLFRYGNYKITSSIKDSIVWYRKKNTDNNGKVKWDYEEYNIIGKTYSDLPKELKQRFNEFQVETVIHEKCTTERITELVRRYNNHTGMNPSQKAVTVIGNFARRIKEISDNKFFIDCGNYTEKEHINGTIERIAMETVMTMFHIDTWKKGTEGIAKFLNDNSSDDEFNKLNSNIDRLKSIIGSEFKELFTSKDSFIWLSAFDKFTEYGIDDCKFADFLKVFNSKLHSKNVNGKSFDELNICRNTKDKSVIIEKLNIIETLMIEYFKVNMEDDDLLDGIEKEDIDFYEDMLSDLTLNVDNSSKLLNKSNHDSMIKLMEYCCKEDIDPDKWFIDYFNHNSNYIKDQKQNFIKMKNSLEMNKRTPRSL